MDEFGVRPLRPTSRGGVDLIWKDADGNRDGDVLRGEKGSLFSQYKRAEEIAVFVNQ